MAKASYVWDGTTWINFGTAGSIGPTGNAATIAVGTVTTGSAGSSATITNVGTSGAAIFNFAIPKGDTGLTGTAATIAVGTVTTGAAGSSATITNVGTTSAATFNFAIPRGDTGTAATIAVGTVTTLSAGSSATVTNAGTSGAATFNFGIPRGDTGLGYNGTSSTTSLVIGTGSKAFTVGSVGAFVVGMRVRASSSATPASYMEGGITSIVGLVITVNVDAIGGTGTKADWVFGVAGSLGAGAYYQATAPSSPLTGYLWVDSSQTLSTYTNVYTQAQVDALLLALQNSLSTTSDQLILANRIYS